jgi:hypothetical protein
MPPQIFTDRIFLTNEELLSRAVKSTGDVAIDFFDK